MAANPVPDSVLLETLQAYRKYGSKAEAARQLGWAATTYDSRFTLADQVGIDVLEAREQLGSLGYNQSVEVESPRAAWDAHKTTFERTMGEALKKRSHVISRPSGPFAFGHFTDEHLDDNATPLKLIEEDIAITRDMDAIRLHGGDVLNNWPMMGRLAKQWAEQECTAPAALLRAQHFFELLEPHAAVHGNHEEMNPYLKSLIEGYLPEDCITDDWCLAFRVKAGRSPEYKVRMSHKFQKGASWFHKTHGHIREMLEAEPVDLLLDGHLHSDGVLDHSLPERGLTTLCVASAGYKVLDKFGVRISKSNYKPKMRGRAHWIVVDPDAEYADDKQIAFKNPRKALAYLNTLQNLETV